MSRRRALVAASAAKITEATPLKVAALVFIFYLQSGVFTIFTMENSAIGRQAASGLILAVLILTPIFMRRNFPLRSPIDLFPAVYFILVILVSYISNNITFKYGWDNWIYYSYVFLPLLMYYAMWSLSVTYRDVIVALIVIGSLAAIIVAIDSIFRLPPLDLIERYTNDTGTRRVTFLKNECVIALLLMVSGIYGGRHWLLSLAIYIVPIAIIFYVLAFLFESRLALSATLAALVFYILSRRIGTTRQIIILGALLLFGVPSIYFILERYISPLMNQSIEHYIINNNVGTRIESADYYWRFFQQTGGLGFGIMTGNVDARNFQVLGLKQSYGVADLGMLGGMYQFGYFGLFMVLSATALMVINFFRLGRSRRHPLHDQMLMMGCFVLAFVLQPVPMDFFSLVWTVMLGTTLWYAMRRARFEQRIITQAQHSPVPVTQVQPLQQS